MKKNILLLFKRATWEDRLIYSIEMGLIISFEQLKNILGRLK